MRDISRDLVLVIMWLAFACNVMLALFLVGRVLSGLVSQLRTAWRSVRGPAHVTRPDGHASVIVESGTEGIISAGRKVRSWKHARSEARPPREPAGIQADRGKVVAESAGGMA